MPGGAGGSGGGRGTPGCGEREPGRQSPGLRVSGRDLSPASCRGALPPFRPVLIVAVFAVLDGCRGWGAAGGRQRAVGLSPAPGTATERGRPLPPAPAPFSCPCPGPRPRRCPGRPDPLRPLAWQLAPEAAWLLIRVRDGPVHVLNATNCF